MNMIFDLPSEVSLVLNRLQENGFSAYIVGGCVRDSFMGVAPYDYDITTSAVPDEMKSVFKDMPVIETGIKHGTLTVLAGEKKMPIEVTVYRSEFGYSDNRRPDKVEFVTDIEEDLSRRDFTMNAIAYDGKTGSDVVDMFDGISDIENKIIRCVGEPHKRFSEDALRIMRALRFSAVLGFKIEPSTKEAIHKNRDRLKNISSERVFVELKKLLAGAYATDVLREYRDVIAVILPELEPMFDFPQRSKYHCYDIWEHTLHSLDGIKRDAALRFAMLFHDTGKPDVHSIEIKNGDTIDHFYAHSLYSKKHAHAALKRLKADNNFKDTVLELILHHDDVIVPSKKSVGKMLKKLGESRLRQLFMIKRADCMGQALRLRKDGLCELDKCIKIMDEIIAEGRCFSLSQLEIDGNDLKNLGFVGRDIGTVLNIVLNAVIEEKVENKREAIYEYISKNIK